MELTTTAWAFALFGAMFVGLGKGGLPGLGNIAIYCYAVSFGGKASVGVLLPVLIGADIVAIVIYRKHARWDYLMKLLPATFMGVILGYFIFQSISHQLMGRVIGGLLLLMTLLHFVRLYLTQKRTMGEVGSIPHSFAFIGGTGIAGGIATMVANAAGPVASFYFMAVQLPKYAFIGTTAWFFFIVNLFKVPFHIAAENLSFDSLQVSLILGIVAGIFASIAPRIVKYIPQHIFTRLVWAVVVLAGVRMLFS